MNTTTEPTTPYIRDYFIAKLESIPNELWTTHSLLNEKGQRCVMGHCGAQLGPLWTVESTALDELLSNQAIPINDGQRWHYQHSTPKARILAALRDLPAS